MAKSIGKALPINLYTLLNTGEPDIFAGRVVPVITKDAQGRPHPALLSFGELYAPDAEHLRLALWKESSTSVNLRRDGVFSLCFVDPEFTVYVKARAQEVGGRSEAPYQAFFLAEIEDVLEDVEPGALIVSGPRFEVQNRTESYASQRRTVSRLLREPWNSAS